MEKNKSMDWGRLFPCDVTETLAYKNVKRIFSAQTEDFCRNITALAIIEHTFSEGYVCKMSELKIKIEEIFGIKDPLNNCQLVSKVFFSEKDEEQTTTSKWLDFLAKEDCERWKFSEPLSLKAEKEQARILSLDSNKVRLLKTTISKKVPFCWHLKVSDVNTGYAYVSSLSKEAISPIWIDSLTNSDSFARICASGVGKYIPVFNLFEFSARNSHLLSRMIKFAISMGFQIIFIEDRDDTVDFRTAYQSELSSALNLTTDIEDTVSINAENFVSLFGKWGTVILDEAQKKEMDLRNVVAMRSSVLALLKKCRKEFSVRNTLQILFSAFSTEKDEDKDTKEIQNSVENPHYSINVINASVSPEILLRMSQKQIKEKMTGLKFLFTGPSGTGKTAFAHYISEKLGIGLITAKASEILARYVGESEKNTCELFKRAKEEGKILLIDEIDAFLGRRDGRDPNLRITVSLVNQFLQEIEEFNGIFLGTTNVINLIDPAFIRRFTKIVDFKYLTEDGIRSLLRLYFPDYVFSESQIKELVSQETLGSGDFGSVYSDVQFLDEGEITPDYIVQSLSELGMIREHKKSRIIGFCAN